MNIYKDKYMQYAIYAICNMDTCCKKFHTWIHTHKPDMDTCCMFRGIQVRSLTKTSPWRVFRKSLLIYLLFLWPNTYFAHSNTILAFTRISIPPKMKRCLTEIHDPHETGQNQLWGFHLTSFFSVKQAPWGKRYIICSPFESMFSLLTVSNNWGSNLVSISSFWQLCIDCMVAMVSWWPAPCRVKLVSGGALMSSLSCSPRPSRCHTHKQEKDCQRLCSG